MEDDFEKKIVRQIETIRINKNLTTKDFTGPIGISYLLYSNIYTF